MVQLKVLQFMRAQHESGETAGVAEVVADGIAVGRVWFLVSEPTSTISDWRLERWPK
jgi:hypothetical protein